LEKNVCSKIEDPVKRKEFVKNMTLRGRPNSEGLSGFVGEEE